ncbi:nucleoside transporter, partial [mine drainage metagenome]
THAARGAHAANALSAEDRAGQGMAVTKVMRVSDAETTSVCASVFIGQTEAPLTIKPHIKCMTEAELMTVMIGGMARIAGSVVAAYVGRSGAK